MQQANQTWSRKAKLIMAASAIVLVLVGSTAVFAAGQKIFSSGYEFQVSDPEEPVVSTSVNGAFINHDIVVEINASSNEGVAKLIGTYSVIIQIWNDASGSYEPFKTLKSNQTITLTPTPTTLQFTFTTDTPGTYNLDFEFRPTSYVLA